MTRGRAYAAALLSGCVLSLAFPEPDVWPFAWLAIAPLLFVARGTSAKRGAALGFIFGIGFFGALVSWVTIVGYVAWSALVLLESAFLAGFGAVWGWLSGRCGPLGRIALAGGAWALFEFARSALPVVGFTWGQLAQSQHSMLWELRWASLAGGVAFGGLIVAVNVAVVEIVSAIRDRQPRSNLVVPAVLIAIAVVGPLAIPRNVAGGSSLTVALVQGNVPDQPPSFEKDLKILNSHVGLTEEIDRPVDLVVWPESAIPIDPDFEGVGDLVGRAARAVGAPMIVGGTDDLGARRYLVEAFLVSDLGQILDRYRKTHLVPFGEYVPARKLLSWLPMLDQVPLDAVRGREAKLFRVQGDEVAPVISFEGDFGSLVRARIAAGGRLLVVATNTSTWGRSWASAQHVAFSQVRAVENGVPVVHAALSGISAVIRPDGSIVDGLPLWTAGSLVRNVTFASTITPYARFGDPLLFVLIGFCGIGWELSRRKRQKVASSDA